MHTLRKLLPAALITAALAMTPTVAVGGTAYTPPESSVTPEGYVYAAPPKVQSSTPGEKHISAGGLLLIERFEGYRRCAYQDSTGVWTAGFGQTRGVGPGFCFSGVAAATANLKSSVETEYEWAVRAAVGNNVTQNEWDALCSFAYNLGAGIFTGELGTLLHEHAFGLAAQLMLQYDHAGGRVLAGLRTRRELEAKLLLTPEQTSLTRAIQHTINLLRVDIRAHKCQVPPKFGGGKYHHVCAIWVHQGQVEHRRLG